MRCDKPDTTKQSNACNLPVHLQTPVDPFFVRRNCGLEQWLLVEKRAFWLWGGHDCHSVVARISVSMRHQIGCSQRRLTMMHVTIEKSQVVSAGCRPQGRGIADL
jgi:hypothetical protein